MVHQAKLARLANKNTKPPRQEWPQAKHRLFPKDFQQHWYVMRPPHVRQILQEMWGKRPEKRHTMEGATFEQKASYVANQFFTNWMMHGPGFRMEGSNHAILRDKAKRGRCSKQDDYLGLNSNPQSKPSKYEAYQAIAREYNRKTKGPGHENDLIPCVSEGFLHVHLTPAQSTLCYVMLFQVFPQQRLFVILDIKKHENFDFGKEVDPVRNMLEGMACALSEGFYDKRRPEINNNFFKDNGQKPPTTKGTKSHKEKNP